MRKRKNEEKINGKEKNEHNEQNEQPKTWKSYGYATFNVYHVCNFIHAREKGLCGRVSCHEKCAPSSERVGTYRKQNTTKNRRHHSRKKCKENENEKMEIPLIIEKKTKTKQNENENEKKEIPLTEKRPKRKIEKLSGNKTPQGEPVDVDKVRTQGQVPAGTQKI